MAPTGTVQPIKNVSRESGRVQTTTKSFKFKNSSHCYLIVIYYPYFYTLFLIAIIPIYLLYNMYNVWPCIYWASCVVYTYIIL